MRMIEIIDALLLKNRIMVSSGFSESMSILAGEIPLTIHRFPSGTEHGTWIIPEQWEVKVAEL